MHQSSPTKMRSKRRDPRSYCDTIVRQTINSAIIRKGRPELIKLPVFFFVSAMLGKEQFIAFYITGGKLFYSTFSHDLFYFED